MSYYVYIIESQLDQSYYIGQTQDLEKRLNQHNNGLSKYTKRKMPWKLVYFEEFENRSDAMRRESFLKRQRNREFYKRLIDNK